MASAGIPIWHSIQIGYTDTFQNLGKLLKLVWVPFLLALTASYLVDVAYHFTRPAGMLDGPDFGALTEPILYTRMIVIDCCLAIFALAIFRYRLRGWSDETDHVRLDLRTREFVFLGAALLSNGVHIGLWSYFIAARTFESLDLLYVGTEFLSLTVYLVTLFVFARLCFVLAAVSLIPESEITGAWRLSLGDWARLVVILAGTIGPFAILESLPRYLSYVPVSLVDIVFYSALDLFGSETAALLSDLVNHVISLALSFLGIAVAVSAVSAAYRAQTMSQPQGS